MRTIAASAISLCRTPPYIKAKVGVLILRVFKIILASLPVLPFQYEKSDWKVLDYK